MILILLPDSDYDPTESAVPWCALYAAGKNIRFATPKGVPAYADARLVEKGFGVLTPFLMTKKADLALYQQMTQSEAFLNPISYDEVSVDDYSALLVPGGHASGMRSMIESKRAQEIVVQFFKSIKPVAAVCHGVLLLARSINPETGLSILHGYKTTALLASLEYLAWRITAPWLGRYYRTYDQTVETEVKAVLANPHDFKRGPFPPVRDSATNLKRGFTVRDGNYLSARWPGDCHQFAADLIKLVN